MVPARTAAPVIVVALVLVVIGAYLLAPGPTPSEMNARPPPDEDTNSLSLPTTSLTSLTKPTTKQGERSSTQPSRTPTTAVPKTPSPTETQTPRPVAFTLESGTPSNCGLTCRETTATITNTGDTVAHSVCVVLEVFTEQGDRIYINAAPSLERCLGDIEGRSSRSETVRIEADCGFLATKCIGQTLILRTRATSRERNEQFPDTVIPV